MHVTCRCLHAHSLEEQTLSLYSRLPRGSRPFPEVARDLCRDDFLRAVIAGALRYFHIVKRFVTLNKFQACYILHYSPVTDWADVNAVS